MDAGVAAEFGMEGGGEEMALADEDREAVAGGEGFYVGAGAGDAGGADEDHLQWSAFEFGRGGEDGGVDLAAVGVALYCDVHGREGGLRGLLDVFGEEDGAGAGAEGGGVLDEGGEDVEELVALKEFEHGGGLAAGDDEAVDGWLAVEGGEFAGGADELGRDTEGLQGFGVGLVGALQGEDADGQGPVELCWLLLHAGTPSLEDWRKVFILKDLSLYFCGNVLQTKGLLAKYSNETA